MPNLTFDGRSFPLNDGETVLDALLRGGADVGFSCRKGSCHTCMLRTVDGDPGVVAKRGLRDGLVSTGHFLPCVCHPLVDLAVELADPSALFVEALIAEIKPIAPGVVSVLLEAEIDIAWTPGQYINLRRPGAADGVTRSYSITSVKDEDYYLEIHVARIDNGVLSTWIHDELAAGDSVEIQGPLGDATYTEAMHGRELTLVATGSGIGAMHGLLRDALAAGHAEPITILHGARTRAGLYRHEALRKLAADHANVRYLPCADQPLPTDDLNGEPTGDVIHHGRVTDLAFRAGDGPPPAMAGSVAVLCGNPDMVAEVRCHAVLAGVLRAQITTDPFESSAPYMPDDREKVQSTPAEPELWAALDDGALLLPILEDFYGRAYKDERLAPFFHNVTLDRAIQKQYEFLRILMQGTGVFFGLRPFNAHHWMVISDDLFDYREAMFEDCVRRAGVPAPMVRRWNALHERFRREIVKMKARGLIIDGVEKKADGFEVETIDCGSVCDGCAAIIEPGEQIRIHKRTGKAFCTACAANRAVVVDPAG